MNQSDFSGRIALVTGGAKGIGRACCERLAAEGAKVAVNYLSSEAAASDVVRKIEADGGKAIAVRADVSSPDDVRTMIDEIESTIGAIDLLVNNAGIFEFVSHDETSVEVWQRTLDVNLTGVYNVTWAVKRGMIEREYGRIVNISSIAALRARPMSIAYSVSKAGVIALTQSLAAAVAGHNVRVNAVAPGLIDTEILADVNQDVLDRLIADTPMGRIGQPEEIAELVLFLLSERSRFMTGQTLVASGGRVSLP